MTVLQPVCTRLPANRKLWDETDLPLSMLITPWTKTTTGSDEHDDTIKITTMIPSLTSIPKCLECGAPHPPGMKSSHYALSNSLLCFLCGYESSTTFDDQREYRSVGAAAGGDGEAYNLPMTNRKLYEAHKSKRQYRNTSNIQEFSLLPPSASPEGKMGIPAMACPPLWFIVLDGSASTQHDLSYWTTVSRALLETIDRTSPPPPHAHFVLIVVTASHWSIFDLTSSTVPHLQHFGIGNGLLGSRSSSNMNKKIKKQMEDVLASTASAAAKSIQPVPWATHSAGIRTAIEALPQCMGKFPQVGDDSTNHRDGMDLRTTLEVLLENFFQEIGHPGNTSVPSAATRSNNNSSSRHRGGGPMADESSRPLSYAGGKLMVLLHSAPYDVGAGAESSINSSLSAPADTLSGPMNMTSVPHERESPVIGRGGIGGSAALVGSRYSDVLELPSLDEDSANNQRKGKKQVVDLDEEEEEYGEEDEPDLLNEGGIKDDDDDVEMGGGTNKMKTSSKNRKGQNVEEEEDIIIPGDVHPEHLAELYPDRLDDPLKTYNYLGGLFAEAAMGIDVLFVAEETGNNSGVQQTYNKRTTTTFGLPFLKVLGERTGAPGPLILTSMNEVCAEVASRVPWRNNQNQSNVGFGGVLRVRCSPGFQVDPNSVKPIRALRKCPQLAPVYVQKGVMGAGTTASQVAAATAAADDDEGLWYFGSVQQNHTTVCCDMMMKGKVRTTGYMEGMGDVVIKSGCQVCFAYTAVEQDPSDEQFYTVRRLRVATLNLPFAKESEVIYANIDPEALLSIFYQKLCTVSFAGGLENAQEDANKWLQSFLIGAYNSAQDYVALQEERAEKGLSSSDTTFYARDRLLDDYGQSASSSGLTRDEVLLGFGHQCLRPMSLLTWSLLQSDALRPSWTICTDARIAAMSQLGTLTGPQMSRAMAPQLDLWVGGERVVENVDLSLEKIQLYLDDISNGAGGSDNQHQHQDVVLLLDSPAEIIVCHAGVLKKDGGISISRPLRPISTPLPDVFQKAVRSAQTSYRVPPPVHYCLDGSPSSAVAVMDRWRDAFLEDSRSALRYMSFGAWKEEIAKAVAGESFV